MAAFKLKKFVGFSCDGVNIPDAWFVCNKIGVIGGSILDYDKAKFLLDWLNNSAEEMKEYDFETNKENRRTRSRIKRQNDDDDLLC